MTRPALTDAGEGPQHVLEVKGLATHFYTEDGVVKAVDGLSYHVDAGECVGIVGESGCGKSVSAMSILRLIPYPPGRIVAGSVLFGGEDLLEVSEARLRQIRGNKIAMIFQEPGTALNPVLTVGRQISEVLELHKGFDKKDALDATVELLARVGIPDPQQRAQQYPHQFSGGMLQRVMIAMALSCGPDLIIADEPTTALDVTVQAQVMETIAGLRSSGGTAVVLITHNLGVVARYVDRVVVMYAGSAVESGPTDDIYAAPLHPYTLGLLRSVPRLDGPIGQIPDVMEGVPPKLGREHNGCPFEPRCRFAMPHCSTEVPPLEHVGGGHYRACFYPVDEFKELAVRS